MREEMATKKHKGHKRVFLCFLCLFVAVPVSVRGEVIDRIVAVVEGHLITLSDLRQERPIR